MEHFEVIEPGHIYSLLHKGEGESAGHTDRTRLTFLKKEPKQPGDSQLVVTLEGTTNEAVLGALIHRIQYLDDKMPCAENGKILQGLFLARDWMDRRAKDRKARGVEGTNKK